MTFDPQIPSWGKDFSNNVVEKLLPYHSWLSSTGVKTGLISPKNDQFIWDEFIVHSLYFYKIMLEMNCSTEDIYDLGTGAGIPGIPLGIVSNNNVKLIDIKQKRVYELERFLQSQKLSNLQAIKADAQILLKQQENTTFVMRCYIPKNSLVKTLEKNLEINKNNTYIISSNSKNYDQLTEKFHVKQEKFFINTNEYRFIDVITVK